MPEMSFRWCASCNVPQGNPRKRAVLAVVLLLLAGCGSGGGGKAASEKRVRGAGYRFSAPAGRKAETEKRVRGPGYGFSAPAGWAVARSPRVVQASDGLTLVSVTLFPLIHPFREALWNKVVPELARVASGVAQQQKGQVASSRTTTVAGRRARSYDIHYERDGKQLVERITFVLRGKTEYYLLCRYAGGDTGACDRLLATFALD